MAIRESVPLVGEAGVPTRREDGDVAAATPRTVRAINDRVTLELLLVHGTLTRTQLAGLTGLSKPTATQLLQRLAESGLIVPRGTTSGAPGPNAQLYALNERAGFVAAVDVDEHRVAAAVADLAGTVLGEVATDVDYTTDEDPVPSVRQVLSEACRQGGLRLRDLDQVVLGVPAAYDAAADRLAFAEHIPGWAEHRTLTRLRAALRTEVVVENDVKLAAVWERRHGAAQDVPSFALLWAGTGLGLAVDFGGTILTGATGSAGEIGYMRLGPAPLRRQRTAGDLPRPGGRRGGGGAGPRARPATQPGGRGRRRPRRPGPRDAVPVRAGPAPGRRTGAHRGRPRPAPGRPGRADLRPGRRGAGPAGQRGAAGACRRSTPGWRSARCRAARCSREAWTPVSPGCAARCSPTVAGATSPPHREPAPPRRRPLPPALPAPVRLRRLRAAGRLLRAGHLRLAAGRHRGGHRPDERRRHSWPRRVFWLDDRVGRGRRGSARSAAPVPARSSRLRTLGRLAARLRPGRRWPCSASPRARSTPC